jgi:hypothetical protein
VGRSRHRVGVDWLWCPIRFLVDRRGRSRVCCCIAGIGSNFGHICINYEHCETLEIRNRLKCESRLKVNANSEKRGRKLTDSSQLAHWHWAPRTDNWGNNTRSLPRQHTSYIALHRIPRRSRGPRVGGRMRSSWEDAAAVADPRRVRGTDNSTGLCSSFTATRRGRVWPDIFSRVGRL